MRLIDRLQYFLKQNGVSAYAFEQSCGLSNGYLYKQLRGRGSVGSDILEKIKYNYPQLSMVWLFTGKGNMQLSLSPNGLADPVVELAEEQAIFFTAKDTVIDLLQQQIDQYRQMIEQKDKIIRLMERTAVARSY